MPAAAPVTMPDAVPTVATVVLLLVQVPPPVVLDSVAVVPEHIDNAPDGVMATGVVYTVTVITALQPTPAL